MPVVGELVQAGVGHQHRGIAEILGEVTQRHVEDAVGIGTGRAESVLVLRARHSEQHQPADPGIDRSGGGAAQGVAGVLHHTRHRRDGSRFVNTVGNEHRQHQMP